jgi:hypothetical protein
MRIRDFIVFLFFIPTVALSSEEMTVCAKQVNGQAYKVEATFATGTELNAATHSSNYVDFRKYIVIFWKQNQVSIIEMDFPYVSVLGTSGIDQQGRSWEVSTSSVCF